MFVGRHERQLDQKGRLAMPPAFRPAFEQGCILAFGQDRCIDIYTPEEFERMAQDVIEAVRRRERGTAERRALFANSDQVGLDGQGRISINPQLREYAGLDLGSPVVVAGDYERVSIWTPRRFDEQTALGTARLGAGA